MNTKQKELIQAIRNQKLYRYVQDNAANCDKCDLINIIKELDITFSQHVYEEYPKYMNICAHYLELLWTQTDELWDK